MALKTIHFVQGLSRTPLLFIPRYYTNICFEKILQNKKISRIENLGIWKSKKPRFTNRSPEKGIKKVAISTKFEGFPVSRKIFLWGHFSKWIFAEGSFNQKPLAFRENPRTHLEVQGPFGDEINKKNKKTKKKN